MKQDVVKQVSKGKADLVMAQPFFGSILMRFPSEDSTETETIVTDGSSVKFNEDWTEKQSREIITGALAHEAAHIAMLHPLRVGSRELKLWNVACDYAINPMIKESGMTMPPGALDDARYHGKTAEQIYEMLKNGVAEGKITVQFSDGSQMGSGKGEKVKAQEWGDMQEHPDAGDPAAASKAETEIKISVLQAAETAKSKGKLPSAFNSLINEYKESKVNWRERIRQFVGGNKPDDYSYRRPNRKQMALNQVMMPTIDYKGAGVVVIGVDSSGSVGQEEMKQFFGEIKSIHAEMAPDLLIVIWCDVQIQHVDRYFPHDEFNDNIRHGNGGTQLSPVFHYTDKMMMEEGLEINSFIFLTDLEVYLEEFKGLDPAYPVLWVSTSADKAPFGEVIKIKAD